MNQWLKKVCNIASFALKLIMCFDEFLLSFKIRPKNARRRRERKVNISFCYVIYIYQGGDGKESRQSSLRTQPCRVTVRIMYESSRC